MDSGTGSLKETGFYRLLVFGGAGIEEVVMGMAGDLYWCFSCSCLILFCTIDPRKF